MLESISKCVHSNDEREIQGTWVTLDVMNGHIAAW